MALREARTPPTVAVSQRNPFSAARILFSEPGTFRAPPPQVSALDQLTEQLLLPRWGCGVGVTVSCSGRGEPGHVFVTVLLLLEPQPKEGQARFAGEQLGLGGWPAPPPGGRAGGGPRGWRIVERCWSLSGKGAHCSGPAARGGQGIPAPRARPARFRLPGLGVGRPRAGTRVSAGPLHVGAQRILGGPLIKECELAGGQVSGNSVLESGCGSSSKGTAVPRVVTTTSAQRVLSCLFLERLGRSSFP